MIVQVITNFEVRLFMKKRIFFNLAGKAARQYGTKWAKQAGNKSVSFLSDIARKKGLTNKSHDLDSLYTELQRKYKQGEINKEEWRKVKSQIRQLWQQRFKK